MSCDIKIPKVIHYCWFSNDAYPEKIQKCIDSWRKHLPDYKIICWNYNNFPRGKSKWVDEAFDAKKYAFAADYIRCYALYHYGGIYLDSDVEVLKSFDDLLSFPYFIGLENEGEWEAAVMGSLKHNNLFRQMLEYYDNRCFIKDKSYDVTPLPHILSNIGRRTYKVKYLKTLNDYSVESTDLQILPYDYFSPKSYKTGNLSITERTYTIHHFTASWHGKKEYLYKIVSIVLGKSIAKFCSKVWKYIIQKNPF